MNIPIAYNEVVTRAQECQDQGAEPGLEHAEASPSHDVEDVVPAKEHPRRGRRSRPEEERLPVREPACAGKEGGD
jgi:hypothetical protein